nr:GGDEF domain-containing protein [Shewanella sp. MEBiC00475]
MVYLQTKDPQQVTFGIGALLNVIEVCIAQILLFRFYEKTRFSAYQKLAIRNLEIQKMAEIDKLTGLYNREKLDEVLNTLLTTSAANTDTINPLIDTEDASSSMAIGQLFNGNIIDKKISTKPDLSSPSLHPISIVIIDIDHFKRINDNHGHLVGDKVLCELAQLLQSKMRNDDLLTRWGGEEFVIILPNTSLADATELTERLRFYIAKQNIQNMALTISLGVTQYCPKDNAHSLLERADKALYQAKSQGRNCVAVA